MAVTRQGETPAFAEATPIKMARSLAGAGPKVFAEGKLANVTKRASRRKVPCKRSGIEDFCRGREDLPRGRVEGLSGP